VQSLASTPSEFRSPLQLHPRPHGRRRLLSWGSADLQRPLRAHVSRYRFAIPPWPRLAAAFAVFRSHASAGEVASPASVSPGLAPPSEFHQSGPLALSRSQPLPWGSFPFSACDRGSPPFPGLPRPVRCAFRVRQPSWRLASATISTALFHAAHARGSPFEAFPFARRGCASRCTLAHLPSARTAPGFRRMPRPAPGPCSPRKSVARAPRGPAARPDAPLGFALSRGFLPVTTAAAYRGPPPTSLAQASHPAPAPRSLDRDRAGSSPWRPPPLLRFLHLVPVPEGSRWPGPGSWFRLECG